MQIINKLSDMIEEELKDAEKYIKCALNHKEDNINLANTFYKLSMEEMQHVNYLHEQVVALIEAYKKEHGDPPEAMRYLYKILHEKHIEHATEIKIMQASYKG